LDEQGGLEIDSNGVMNMSQEAKKEKKARDRQKKLNQRKIIWML